MSQFTGTVYEVILEGNVHDRPTKNVFHYASVSGSPTADNVCSAFAEDFILPILLSSCGDDMTFTGVNARGVQIATDFDDNVISEVGTVVGGSEPAFVAAGYKLLRPDSLSRHGFKRIPGVPDDYWDGGQPTVDAVAKWAAVAANLAAGISTGGRSYALVVQRRQQDNVVLDPPTYWNIAGVGATGITTQNTRK